MNIDVCINIKQQLLECLMLTYRVLLMRGMGLVVLCPATLPDDFRISQ